MAAVIEKRHELRAPDRARVKVWDARLKIRQQRKSEAGVELGIFEAYPSIFGNVDSYGERVIRGAFEETLSEWKEKGAPIPVIFAHQWDDPEMHLGVVTNAEERERGLWVEAQLDLDMPKAAHVWKLLTHRRITQFSFAFDVLAGEKAEDTYVDPFFDEEVPVFNLTKLKLYEIGPCLVGVNQETELLATKTLTVGAARKIWFPKQRDPKRSSQPEPRKKEGREFSAANFQRLGAVREHASTILQTIDSMLDAGSGDGDTEAAPREAGERLAAAPSTAQGVPIEPSSSPQRRNHWPAWLRSSDAAANGGSDGPHSGAAPAGTAARRSR